MFTVHFSTVLYKTRIKQKTTNPNPDEKILSIQAQALGKQEINNMASSASVEHSGCSLQEKNKIIEKERYH